MNFWDVEKIANAVLYEGFLLYPYRRSSLKNQHRWHFGTLGPAGGNDPTEMRTECLLKGSSQTRIVIKIRFLQDKTERELVFSDIPLAAAPEQHHFTFLSLDGLVEWSSIPISDEAFRLTVLIQNLSQARSADCLMLSTHTLLAVQEGAFISLLDPPEVYRSAAAACRNLHTWPVLAGSEGECQMLLSSPIILYDYPQVARESPGDFFDGTEIDEMLALRVLTLSDEEKQEIREGDEHGRDILERTETLPAEHLAKLHGAIRELRQSSMTTFRKGDRVRLRPRKRADIFDIALQGKTAIVESIECDFENRVYLAVTIEDDPGRDLGAARQIGHRFFFSPEEAELL